MNREYKETKAETVKVIETFGSGPYMEYRIPGITATKKGALLCCYEGRKEAYNDWSPIDVVVLRSMDQGKTFSRTVLSPEEKKQPGESVTWNNPVLIADQELVHLIYHKNYEAAYYCVSEDDGKTFSKPIEITEAFREFPYQWNVCASGPGHGIVTKGGRLLVPVWLAQGESLDETGRRKAHNPSVSGTIYSDDRGKTWHAGVLTKGIANANETSIAELSDGRILFNIRNAEPEKCRVLGLSQDGIQELSDLWLEPGLPDPKCFGSMVRLDEKRLGFVNCASNDLENALGKRIYLTFYVSNDSGRSWKPWIDVDCFGGYADAAVFENQLYLFYEQSLWTEKEKRVNRLLLKTYKI